MTIERIILILILRSRIECSFFEIQKLFFIVESVYEKKHDVKLTRYRYKIIPEWPFSNEIWLLINKMLKDNAIWYKKYFVEEIKERQNSKVIQCWDEVIKYFLEKDYKDSQLYIDESYKEQSNNIIKFINELLDDLLILPDCQLNYVISKINS